MRYLFSLCLFAVALVGCGGPNQSDFVRIGDHTFRIEGPSIAGGAVGPNQRMAQQLCPGGYRVLSSDSHRGGVDRATLNDANSMGITTIWVVKCI
ncbi:MAG TPA: hypothetical protein VNV38_18965 [Stellaceae bacterium]|jgi:hypothetical protein|nr:hypothetical protein [Stellaceae bacterium]